MQVFYDYLINCAKIKDNYICDSYIVYTIFMQITQFLLNCLKRGENLMNISKAQYNASNKYIKNNYISFSVRLKKEIGLNLQNFLEENNISRNEYIICAIKEKMERDGLL